MKIRRLVFVFALFLPILAVSGTADMGGSSCGKLPHRLQYSPPDNSTDGCICGTKLGNILAPLTKPFSLKAACNLRWMEAGDKPEQEIDLLKEQLSFERYKEGYIPRGQLLLIGTATLSGTLLYEEGPAGEWWFHPKGNPISSRGPLKSVFATLKLTGEHSFQEFRVPRSLQKANCWEANAILKISNIWLTLGETDEAGAYPAMYSVTSISNHRRCK